MDIGTPERYLQASWDILEGRVATEVRPTAPGLLIGAGARSPTAPASGRAPSSRPGCRIAAGAQVRDSVLLDGCEVGAGATVSGSILAAGVAVAAGAELAGAVIGQGERVPA